MWLSIIIIIVEMKITLQTKNDGKQKQKFPPTHNKQYIYCYITPVIHNNHDDDYGEVITIIRNREKKGMK